jgi:hypothetical protein
MALLTEISANPFQEQINTATLTNTATELNLAFHPYSEEDIKLDSKWVFWFESAQEESCSARDYIKQLVPSSGAFGSLQHIYDFCIQNSFKYQRILLFKEGIKPIWEDPHNVDGGRFFVHCQNQKQAFEHFLLVTKTIIPGKILDNEDLCGIIYAYKPQNRFSLSVWHKNSKDKAKIKEIRAQLKVLFNVKTVSYHNHRASIKLSHSPSMKNDCGMNTYPPKKKTSDTFKFEASLNLIHQKPSSNRYYHKHRSMSYDLGSEYSHNGWKNNSLSTTTPVTKSEAHSRRQSFDKNGERPPLATQVV